jgi:hypothetical protein
MLVEAAAGVRPTWAYAVGGGAGAIGGAIVGFASDEAGNAQLSMGLMVGALVLAVPTTLAVLGATTYRAPAIGDGSALGTGSGAPRSFGNGPQFTSHRLPAGHPFALHVRRSPTSFLVDYHQQSLAIGVPDVKVSQVYSRLEWTAQRVPDATQVLVPLFKMSF